MARHALLIGVQDYVGSGNMTPLACPRADVDLMASLLTEPAYTGEPYRVVALKDTSLEQIRTGVDDFVEDVARDDTVIVYFSGHGMRDNVTGDLYLCTTDTREDRLHSTGYEFTLLSRSLKRHRLRKVLIILDCCYSGAAYAKGPMTPKLDEVEETGENGTGTYVISSGGQTETSIEDKEKDYSLFTKVLAEGIRTGAPDRNGNGVICVNEIAAYVAREVPKRAAEQGIELTGRAKLQQPQVSSNAAFGEFVIAVNAARAGEEKRRKDNDLARSWIDAGRRRLAAAVLSGDAPSAFLVDVDAWIDAQKAAETIDPSHPRITALRDYGMEDTGVGLMPFKALWDAAAADPVQRTATPVSMSEPAAPPPQVEMATKAPAPAAVSDDRTVDTVASDDMDRASALLQGGLDRLRNARANGHVTITAVAAVEKAAVNGSGQDPDDPRLAALRAYGRKALSLKDLLDAWGVPSDPLPEPTSPEPANPASATADPGGADYSWIIATIIGVAGLALGLFLVHLALAWLVDAVPPVDWSVPYAAWPPGFKILVIAGFLAVTIGLIYAIVSALFDYEADLALGIVLVSAALLTGVYLFFYASLPVLAELDAFFLRIMGVYDWVVGLFMLRPPAGAATM